MQLSAEQARKFLHLQRKHNVSVDFILSNMPAILKFVQYAITPHVVLKVKLIRKRNRTFLRYNHVQKLMFDPSQLKKMKRAKRFHSQWSKRLVMYLRRYKTVESFEDKVRTETKLHNAEVSKQLKEQLELLKTGKRTVPLFQDTNNLEHRENDLSMELVPRTETFESQEADPAESENISEGFNSEMSSDVRAETPLLTVVEVLDDVSKSSNDQMIPEVATASRSLSHGSDRAHGNFLDMLISKVKSSTDNINETEAQKEKTTEPLEQSIDLTIEDIVENGERENSNSSSDFFGFDDSERVLGTFPGMLSTPLVRKRDFNSAFESETLNAYMRDNSLESSAIVDFPQRRPDDGLIALNSIPPKLDMPAVPEGLQSLRTVAERRSFLQRSKNLKYGIVNNVGTIFRELQKRIKGHRINKNAIETLQTSSSVPLTRQSWKTASWLLTDEGNYYFQTMTVDGKNFRLFGCRGNSQKKMKKSHSNKCSKISSVCTDDCMDRVIFRALRPVRTIEKRSKLKDGKPKIACKACPLSQKVLYQSQDDETTFGSLEVVRMPHVELEVYPQLQKPLHDIAKRYLQLVLPYDGISREWAEFSVSTLVENDKLEAQSKLQDSFTFLLPYANDRNHVLVRRVYNRLEAFEGQFDKSNFSFRKEIDQKKTDGEPPDLLAEECADILTDMLNSVAISCSENSFMKNDPDNIYQYGNTDNKLMEDKAIKKSVELHQHHVGVPNIKRQNRLLNELRRLNATIIDAAAIKSEEGIETNSITCNQRYGLACDKLCCKLGCICASLNEGTAIRQHCGKQRCILECNCKCPGIMRVETDGRTITTEDAFMLRRQATARLARMEKDFTSTVVLTGSETLLINESQYDKKRRCTKIPKRYGDFVDPDESDLCDNKSAVKRTDAQALSNIRLDPIMVKDKIYQRLRHCRVNVKRLRDVKDLAPWCMVHMVYKCYCKGQATDGIPIVVEKHEELTGGMTIDEAAATKGRILYSFEKEETKTKEDAYSCDESESSEFDITSHQGHESWEKECTQTKVEKRGRLTDYDIIQGYMNAKANHCRRIVPIPRNLYLRRNKKRVARVQLYIAENETDETRLSLNEHVLRSVYYHRNNQYVNKRQNVVVKEGLKLKQEENNSCEPEAMHKTIQQSPKASATVKRKSNENKTNDSNEILKKKRRMSTAVNEEGISLLRANSHRKESKKPESIPSFEPESLSLPLLSPSTYVHLAHEQITVPKISQIFSLNSQAMEMGTDTAAAVAADIPQQSTEAAASAEGVTSDAFKNVFQVVIKNMNNLVSKKMQDIDMALRRESKAIPAPNDEILCIIRWNNFLEAFMDGYVYLWEVRTTSNTFIAATVKNIMPLVLGALSVVNLKALSRAVLPLLGRMLIDKIRNPVTDGLAVVMQGQKMYWFVKGFLRPDKSRICPKPTPESHPLLTRKINILCRLLINQQINEHKKRQEVASQIIPLSNVPSPPLNEFNEHTKPKSKHAFKRLSHYHMQPKIKVLPMQRNISEYANNILEQMVTQAYGVIATNLCFRKVRQMEVNEVYQPAHMSTDHYWLVLDLSNDFSHIFISELKDLLTLDRIQKVIAYAVGKNRIVKMQFCEKSSFNAYVTPMSRRKLYFGPFKGPIQAPKLVLLQSVDGQMMLREVYEARHNVATKTDRTTAFWLIQKDKKLILDVESDSPLVFPHRANGNAGVQIDIEEAIDDDVFIVSSPRSDSLPTQDIQAKPNYGKCMSFDGNIGMEYLKEAVQHAEEEEDCILIEDDAVSLLPVPSPTLFTPLMPVAPSTLISPLTSATPSTFVSPIIPVSPSTLVSPITPVTSSTTDPPSSLAGTERINYTISYTGDNSSLVVVRNECELIPGVVVDDIQNNFTILNSEPVSLLPIESINTNNTQQDLPQSSASKNKVSKIKHQSSQKAKHDLETNQGSALSSSEAIDSVQSTLPNVVSEVVPTPVQVDNQPKPVTHNSTEEKVSETIAPINVNATNCGVLDKEQKTTEKDSNILTLTTASMKWNKNVTITKIMVDNEHGTPVSPVHVPKTQQIHPAPMQKLLPVTNTPPGIMKIQNPAIQKVRMVPPAGMQPRMRPAIIRQPILRPRVPNARLGQTPPSKASPSVMMPQQVRPAVKPQSPANLQPARLTIQKNIPSTSNQPQIATTPRPATSPQGSLIVRTPSAINTYIKTQQQQQQQHLVRLPTPGSSLLRHPNSNPPMRPPSTLSLSPRATFNVRPAAAYPTSLLKHSPQNVATNKALSPILQKNLIKPVISPQKTVLKRVFVNAQLPPEGPEKTKLQRFLATGNGTTSKNHLTPQSDPLHISEELSNTICSNLPQPKLPNDLKTIKIKSTPLQKPLPVIPALPVTSTEATISGLKKNPVPMILNRSSTQIQPLKQSSSLTETTTISSTAETIVTSLSNPTPAQTVQVKGIPIELPRLKKFAIIGSSNTTVITPSAGQVKKSETSLQPKQDQIPTTSAEQTLNSKINPGNMAKCLPVSSSKTSSPTTVGKKSIVKVAPRSNNSTVSVSNADDSTNSGTEYGYFHANMEGLPKFVVKRVNDDFLIKVPNFNGILKLPGLATVYNYLNQYTVQKCGKSATDIKNLKWMFKVQDRSKLNIVNKPNTPLVKSGNTSPLVQKLLTPKGASSIRPLPPPSNIAKSTAKPNVACAAKAEADDLIVLVDDE